VARRSVDENSLVSDGTRKQMTIAQRDLLAARDSSGRIFCETTSFITNLKKFDATGITHIYDPVLRESTWYAPGGLLADMLHVDALADLRELWRGQTQRSGEPTGAVSELPAETIAGLAASAYQVSKNIAVKQSGLPVIATMQEAVSEMQELVLRRQIELGNSCYSERVIELTATEPPASLFELPAGIRQERVDSEGNMISVEPQGK
jgi:hypothetical protein